MITEQWAKLTRDDDNLVLDVEELRELEVIVVVGRRHVGCSCESTLAEGCVDCSGMDVSRDSLESRSSHECSRSCPTCTRGKSSE